MTYPCSFISGSVNLSFLLFLLRLAPLTLMLSALIFLDGILQLLNGQLA